MLPWPRRDQAGREYLPRQVECSLRKKCSNRSTINNNASCRADRAGIVYYTSMNRRGLLGGSGQRISGLPHSSSWWRPLTSPFSSPSIGGRRPPRLPSRRHEGTRPLLRHRQEGYFLLLLLSPRYHCRHLSLTASPTMPQTNVSNRNIGLYTGKTTPTMPQFNKFCQKTIGHPIKCLKYTTSQWSAL
jgi:hypothetical protein